MNDRIRTWILAKEDFDHKGTWRTIELWYSPHKDIFVSQMNDRIRTWILAKEDFDHKGTWRTIELWYSPHKDIFVSQMNDRIRTWILAKEDFDHQTKVGCNTISTQRYLGFCYMMHECRLHLFDPINLNIKGLDPLVASHLSFENVC